MNAIPNRCIVSIYEIYVCNCYISILFQDHLRAEWAQKTVTIAYILTLQRYQIDDVLWHSCNLRQTLIWRQLQRQLMTSIRTSSMISWLSLRRWYWRRAFSPLMAPDKLKTANLKTLRVCLCLCVGILDRNHRLRGPRIGSLCHAHLHVTRMQNQDLHRCTYPAS